MNNETVPRIVVGGGMAAALAIGIAIFAFRHPAAPAVALQPAPPPPIAEQAPPTPPQVAQAGEGASQPAPTDSAANADATPAAPVAKSRPTPTQPRNRPVTPSPTAASVGAAGSRANSMSPDSASGAAVPPVNVQGTDGNANDATAGVPPDASRPGAVSDSAATDRQITTDVKSEISRDQSSNGANVDVTTDHGVVTLSGTVPDQGTLDRVKETVARVQGVTSVDASALTIASQVSFAGQQ